MSTYASSQHPSVLQADNGEFVNPIAAVGATSKRDNSSFSTSSMSSNVVKNENIQNKLDVAVKAFSTSENETDNCVHIFRLCISDNFNSTKYLIETGADVSVVPFTSSIKPNIHSVVTPKLYAANGTPIKTFGILRQKVDLGLRRDFTWNFVIADVKQAMLGADFLEEFNLLIDVRNKILRDGDTEFQKKCVVSKTVNESIKRP